MKFNRLSTNKIILTFSSITLLFLSACSSSVGGTLDEIDREIYTKKEYETADVMQGDLDCVINLTLKPESAGQIMYSVDMGDLEPDEVKVSVGDSVKAGQLLASFKSEDLQKEIEELEFDLQEKSLMFEHYIKLAEVETRDKTYENVTQEQLESLRKYDSDSRRYTAFNYSVIIEELADDVELASLYLQEKRAKLEACRVKAKEDGVITFLSQDILGGVVEPGVTFAIESCGENRFVGETEDDYIFPEGEIYEGYTEAGDKIDLYLADEEPLNGSRKLIFVPVVDTVDPSGAKSLSLTVKKETLHNVIYIPTVAINTKKNDTFVYVVDDKGYLSAAYVTCGDTVGDNTIILFGLTGSEKVVIK